jgi:hypothetical protein
MGKLGLVECQSLFVSDPPDIYSGLGWEQDDGRVEISLPEGSIDGPLACRWQPGDDWIETPVVGPACSYSHCINLGTGETYSASICTGGKITILLPWEKDTLNPPVADSLNCWDSQYIGDADLTVATLVPEPGGSALMLGVLVLAVLVRWKSKK